MAVPLAVIGYGVGMIVSAVLSLGWQPAAEEHDLVLRR